MTDTWRPPEPDTIWRFTVDGAEHILGRKLRDGERERIAKAFDASSIPDAVDEIMFQFRTPVYIARFSPEAWQRDNAIPVDPEGDTEWDCTEYLLEVCEESERTREIILEPLDAGDDDPPFGVLDNDDVLKDDPKAPEWVREWRGPFNIHVRKVED